MVQSQAIALPLINSPSMPHRPAQVFDPATDQMKTTAEAADVIPLGASFPSLAMGMGDVRARCFRQGLPCPANPKAPGITPAAFSFLSPFSLLPLRISPRASRMYGPGLHEDGPPQAHAHPG
jgi:hypothetical protein